MKNKEFWHSILWSDESKFNLFGSDGRQIVWRQLHESMKRVFETNREIWRWISDGVGMCDG